MHPYLKTPLIAMGLGLILLAGCSDSDQEMERLRENKRQWQSQNARNYRFEFRANCFCGSEFTSWVAVKVQEGDIDSVIVKETGEAVAESSLNQWFTVPELFATAEKMIGEADSYEIEYDVTYGYPTRISADVYRNAIDDEFDYYSQNLRIE